MIAEEIQSSLREQYNPEGSERRLLQRQLLILLQHVDEVCRQHDIKYWLSSGTCLGAIRHGGFIPWDDDIDIEMMREDYLKFIKVWQDDPDFVMQTYKNDLYYTQPFPKIRMRHTFMQEGHISNFYQHKGLFLDIFVMERSNAVVAHLCHGLLGGLRHLSYRMKPGPVSDFMFSQLKHVCFGIINGMRTFSYFSKSSEVRHALGTGIVKNIRKKDEIFPLSEAEFEGVTYPIPGKVDNYLTRMFGNYMSLPSSIHTHKLSSISFLSKEDYDRLTSQYGAV